MPKVTIIAEDSIVAVDGRVLTVDLTDFPSDIRAVQWDGENGHIEKTDYSNEPLNNLGQFNRWVARWAAQAQAEDNRPPPPTPPRRRELIDWDVVKADPGLAYMATHTPAQVQLLFQSELLAGGATQETANRIGQLAMVCTTLLQLYLKDQ